MGNQLARCLGIANQQPAHPLPIQCVRSQPSSTWSARPPPEPQTVYHCSSEDASATKQLKHQSQLRISQPADPLTASFLDLPGELRNAIYCSLLLFPEYIRGTPYEQTKVPALILLRVCKQVHDEAASVFYAGNSLYSTVERSIDLHFVEGKQPYLTVDILKQDGTKRKTGTTASIKDIDNLRVLDDAFFPAPTYHRWLTRLTVDTKVWIREPKLSRLERDAENVDQTIRESLEKTRVEVVEMSRKQFKKMRQLWLEKEGKWEGTLRLHPQMQRGSSYVTASVSFFQDEEVECGIKWALRGGRERVLGCMAVEEEEEE